MALKRLLLPALAGLFAAPAGFGRHGAAKLELREAVVVVGSDAPSHVRYAVGELVRFARESGDVRIAVSDRPSASSVPRVLVGRATVETVLGKPWCKRAQLDETLGDEGFVLKAIAKRRPPTVVAAGWTDRGTRWAVYELIKALDVTSRPATIRLPLDRRERPFFVLRGMYAHQHWAYRYPYALRTWSVEDWKRYVDLLAYCRYNLLQIWSMVGIMPMPLGPSDEAFLRKYPTVIEHAHRNHAMEVWIGECANNVARGHGLPPMEERDYFAAETLLNPADRNQMRQLIEARRLFYSICNNADGYWIIDSDPGGWRGSSAEEFVEIFAANRRLVDECTRLGRRAKMIYWMWMGWGTKSRQENLLEAVRGLKERVHEPLWFTACWNEHFRAVRSAGALTRTVYYPYNAVEPEPSMPFTAVVPERLKRALSWSQVNRLGQQALDSGPAIMGNAQTPLVQLPNIYYFGRCAWAYERDGLPDRTKAVSELARLVFPQRSSEIASAWMALAGDDPKAAREAAIVLDDLLTRKALGPPGPIGLKITPRAERLVEDLVAMLKLHGLALEFVEAAARPETPDAELIDLLRRYVLRSIAWRHRNGFKKSPWDPVTSPRVYSAAHKRWDGRDGLPERILRPLREAIAADYGEREAAFTLAPICSKKR